MPVACVAYRLPAGPRTVAGLLRDREFAIAALGRAGHGFRAERRLLGPGDRVRIDLAFCGLRVPARTVVDGVTPAGFSSSWPGLVRHEVRLTVEGAGTRVDDVITWAAPVGRRLVADLLAARAAELRERVAGLTGMRVVVATALIRNGRVLAAQRTRPPDLAGLWELPGGSVEPGEFEEDAVVRECREELGATVLVGGRLGTDLLIDAAILRVHRAVLAPGSPEPAALDHAALRWVDPGDLEGVAWVDADRAVLPDLRSVLEA